MRAIFELVKKGTVFYDFLRSILWQIANFARKDANLSSHNLQRQINKKAEDLKSQVYYRGACKLVEIPDKSLVLKSQSNEQVKGQ